MRATSPFWLTMSGVKSRLWVILLLGKVDLFPSSVKQQIGQFTLPYQTNKKKNIKGVEKISRKYPGDLPLGSVVLFIFFILSFANLEKHCQLTGLAQKPKSHRWGWLVGAPGLTVVPPAADTCPDEQRRCGDNCGLCRMVLHKVQSQDLASILRITCIATAQDLPFSLQCWLFQSSHPVLTLSVWKGAPGFQTQGFQTQTLCPCPSSSMEAKCKMVQSC